MNNPDANRIKRILTLEEQIPDLFERAHRLKLEVSHLLREYLGEKKSNLTMSAKELSSQLLRFKNLNARFHRMDEWVRPALEDYLKKFDGVDLEKAGFTNIDGTSAQLKETKSKVLQALEKRGLEPW